MSARSIGASVRRILIAAIEACDDPDTTTVLISVGEDTGYWGARQSSQMRRVFAGSGSTSREPDR